MKDPTTTKQRSESSIINEKIGENTPQSTPILHSSTADTSIIPTTSETPDTTPEAGDTPAEPGAESSQKVALLHNLALPASFS